MPNATHPLDNLDRETLNRTLDLLSQNARHISDTWDEHPTWALREYLAEVQDILTRSIDTITTIENHETGESISDTIKPIDPWKRDTIVNRICTAYGIEVGSQIPDWVWDAADKVIAIDT